MRKEERKNHRLYNQYRTILEEFTPPYIHKTTTEERYDVADYYGVGYIPYKKDNTFGVSLFYDYINGNAKKGNTLILDTFEEVIEFINIMHIFRVDKQVKKKAKFDLSNVKDYTKEETQEVKAVVKTETTMARKPDLFH